MSESEEEITLEQMQEIIDAQEDLFEYYDTEYRYLPRQSNIPTSLMNQIIDNFLRALESGEYFDGGYNDGLSFIEEITTSPSLSKLHKNRIYEKVFEGTDSDEPLKPTLLEYDEGSLLISSSKALDLIRKLKS